MTELDDIERRAQEDKRDGAGIARFRASLNLGRVAASLEADAASLRRETYALASAPFIASEGRYVRVASGRRESGLLIEIPFTSNGSVSWRSVWTERWEELPTVVKNCTEEAYHMDEVAFRARSLEWTEGVGVVAYAEGRVARVVLEDHSILVLGDLPPAPASS